MRYKILDGEGRITNIIEADEEFAAQVGAVLADDGDVIYSEPSAEPANPTEWLIDIGPFFDRFGAAKMSVLTCPDVTVRAIIQDVQVRKWVDLKRPDVAQAFDVLISKAVSGVDAALKDSVLNTPVTPEENLALRKLYFA